MKSIAVLILAAGASTRMEGGPKQLLPWQNTTLLGHAIEQAKQLSELIFVVLGAYADEIEKVIPDDVEIIYNPHWENGMGSSISVGIEHLQNSNEKPTGVLVMLADQPLLDATYLQEIKSDFENKPCKIVATSYGNKLGVPAIFDNSLLPQLAKLHEDVGAKHIIEKNKTDTITVFPKGKEIDIDTKKEYTQYINNK
ncbi:nucleotidyltransferase family protein [Flagellimonas marina]|uniref:NTP transferase domain-containing protein n=1 Tax=Flagellimonas marina TaxID=1775168 RepID=A0ABV8PLZ4_9FLAO